MYLLKAAKWNAQAREDALGKVLTFLKTHPCVDCGESDPVVLTFDHVRGTKKANVSEMLAGKCSWSTIESEIAKCEVRCANCHMRRTAQQLKYRKFFAGLALVVKAPAW